MHPFFNFIAMKKMMIIVPDIHGRNFWRAVRSCEEDIVFLGDYLDPYNSEGVTREMAIRNFREILLFAKSRPGVSLLLGNHDLSYMKGDVYCRCRTDYENYDYIRSLFHKNITLFNIAKECEVAGQRFLFSHAGITPGWHSQHTEIFPASYEETLREDLLNSLYHEGKMDGILHEISRYRAGSSPHGSIVWADVREFEDQADDMSDCHTTQIVGHTQCANRPANFMPMLPVCDVDNRQCYYIDEQGILRYLSDDEMVMTSL